MSGCAAPTPAASAHTAGFDPRLLDRLVRAEGRHFWFRSRSAVIASLLRSAAPSLGSGALRVAEVGCGTGAVLSVLDRECARDTLVGTDLFTDGLDVARSRVRRPLVRADATALPFRGAFHAIGLFDVLEHIDAEQRALREIRAALVPGGALLVTVPALQSLWSEADVLAGHHRRYTVASLRAALTAAGFVVEYVTYLFAVTFPLFWLSRQLCRTRSASAGVEHAGSELRVVPVVNELLSRVLALERWAVGRRMRLPFGSSVLALARAGGE